MDKLLVVREQLGNIEQEKFWRIGEKTGNFLQESLKQTEAKHVLEIGTSSGYSALWLLEVLRSSGGHLWTIESHAKRFEMAKENFSKAEVSQLVTQVKGHAPEAVDELDASLKFDLVFIDATKYETQIHFEASFNRLKPGGIIVIDNIATHREQFRSFFEYLKDEGIKFEEKSIEAGLLIVNF